MAELQNPDVYRLVLDSLQTGILVTDRAGKILFWNEGAEHLAGYIRHEVLGRSQKVFLPHCEGRDCPECGKSCPFTRTLHGGKATEQRMKILHKQGHLVPVFIRVAAIRDLHGSVVATATSFSPQSRQLERGREPRQPVPHECLDEVTGVANRGFTEFHLREKLRRFRRVSRPLQPHLHPGRQFGALPCHVRAASLRRHCARAGPEFEQ